MGHTQHRATEVAKTLSGFIKADLAEGLSLALIHRKFPGMTRDEILHVLDIRKDEATLGYERSQEVLATMQVMPRFLGCLIFGARNLKNSAA